MTDKQMRNAVGRRQKVFDKLLLTVFQHIQVLPHEINFPLPCLLSGYVEISDSLEYISALFPVSVLVMIYCL
jgi:hypothetical protein